MAKRPSFFKILLFDFRTRLRIPPKFTTYIEKSLLENLPQESVLETSDGRFWHVDVEKVGNNVCFKYGWKQFVRYNSLKLGDLIVFNYQGSFRFKLEFYGRNCCQKRVEMFKKRLQRPRKCKTMSRNRQRPVRQVESENLSGGVDHIAISDSDDESNDGESLSGQRENPKKTSSLQTDDDDENNDGEISCGQRENPKKTSPQQTAAADVNNNGESLCSQRENPKKNSPLQTADNDENNDGESLCGQRENPKKTSPLQTADDGENSCGQRENRKKTSPLQTADNFTSVYPFFKVAMTHSYVYRSYLCLPKRFMRANGLKLTGKKIKLVFSDKTWLVKMQNPPVYTRLCTGWNAFVKDTKLKEDNVCVFELIDKVDVSFRVSIFPNIS